MEGKEGPKNVGILPSDTEAGAGLWPWGGGPYLSEKHSQWTFTNYMTQATTPYPKLLGTNTLFFRIFFLKFM